MHRELVVGVWWAIIDTIVMVSKQTIGLCNSDTITCPVAFYKVAFQATALCFL